MATAGKYWVFYEYGTQALAHRRRWLLEGKQYQRTPTKPLLSDGTSHAWR